MPKSEKQWFLIGLVFAFVTVGGLLTAFYLPNGPGNNDFFLAILGMLPSHAALAAFWAALGGKARPWRLTAAIVGIVVLMYAYTSNDDFSNHFGLWYFISALLLGIQSGLLMVGRFLGVELTNLESDRQLETAEDREWMQFSIGSVLSWTTAAAIIMATLRYVPEYCLPPNWDFPPEAFAVISAVVVGATLIALSSIWITLGSRRAAARFVLLGICAATAIGALMLAISRTAGNEFWQIVIFFLSQVFWITGSLWLVRLAGFRLIWRRRVRF